MINLNNNPKVKLLKETALRVGSFLQKSSRTVSSSALLRKRQPNNILVLANDLGRGDLVVMVRNRFKPCILTGWLLRECASLTFIQV